MLIITKENEPGELTRGLGSVALVSQLKKNISYLVDDYPSVLSTEAIDWFSDFNYSLSPTDSFIPNWYDCVIKLGNYLGKTTF